jgi:hypothetical protein
METQRKVLDKFNVEQLQSVVKAILGIISPLNIYLSVQQLFEKRVKIFCVSNL